MKQIKIWYWMILAHTTLWISDLAAHVAWGLQGYSMDCERRAIDLEEVD